MRPLLLHLTDLGYLSQRAKLGYSFQNARYSDQEAICQILALPILLLSCQNSIRSNADILGEKLLEVYRRQEKT